MAFCDVLRTNDVLGSDHRQCAIDDRIDLRPNAIYHLGVERGFIGLFFGIGIVGMKMDNRSTCFDASDSLFDDLRL